MRSLADSINAACANPKLITGGDPSDFGQKKILAAKLKEKLRSSRRFFVDDEVTRACDSYVRPRHKARIWFLGIYRMIDIERFADWLYDDASIWMDRKRDLFLTQKNALVAA